MSYTSQISTSPGIRLPQIAIPKLRWPRLSSRARAVMMMGLMASPIFLFDYVGYGIKRLAYSPAQIAQMQMHDETIMSRMEVFQVACADPATPPAEQRWWAAFAAQRGWPTYPQAGDMCFRPATSLLGVVGLKTFNVACPTIALTVADRGRWMKYAAERGWDAYPQAGKDCVDP